MIRRRLAACRVVVLVSVSIESCAAHRTLTSAEVVAPPKEASRFARFAAEPGQEVTGYVTRDGMKHEFHGRARLEGDTLVLRGAAQDRGMEEPVTGATERVALADLQSVRSRTVDPLRTTLLVTGLVVLGLVIHQFAVDAKHVYD